MKERQMAFFLYCAITYSKKWRKETILFHVKQKKEKERKKTKNIRNLQKGEREKVIFASKLIY